MHLFRLFYNRRLGLMLVAVAIASIIIALKPQPSLGEIETTQWNYASFPVVEFQEYSSPFGMRWHPITGTRKLHKGQDIAAPQGSNIVAWWGGKVLQVGFDAGGWGNYIVILSGRWEHLYAHCSTIFVKQGQTVKTKDRIARIGQTGGATGPHLHWELRHQTASQKNVVDSSQWSLINPAEVLWRMYKAQYPTSSKTKPTSFNADGYTGTMLETY